MCFPLFVVCTIRIDGGKTMRDRTVRIEENLRRVCYKIKKKGREILNDVEICMN